MFRLFLVSAQIFIGYQVVYPIINGEGKGREPHAVYFVVLNVSVSQESMVLMQQVEGGPESWDVEADMLIYGFPPHLHQGCTISCDWLISSIY